MSPEPAQRAAPRVGIVVLNWNGYAATRRCLDSLATATYPCRTIYVADNGSTDGSAARIEAESRGGDVVVLRNGANLGFSAGCNPAIRRALADGCDYVLLINNDCVVGAPDFLESMVALAEADPRVGLVGGKVTLWPDTGALWETGGWIRWAGERYVGFGERDHGQYEEVAERGFVSGALMLVRREVLARAGLLPEAYFFGHEDWEYGLRVRRLGYRLLYQPRAVVHHEAERSHEPADPYYLYNGILSKILFKKRNLSRPSYRAWLAAYGLYARWLVPVLARLDPRRYAVADVAGLREVLLAALAEAPGLERVTPEMLERFRGAREPARGSRPPDEAGPAGR